MRYFIHPYKQGSKGAKALALALGGRVLRRVGSSYVPRGNDVVINWGDGECPRQSLNQAAMVRRIANKRLAFDVFSSAGVTIPRYAIRKEDVTWEGMTVVRHKLTGHSGEGIELVEGKDLPDAPLYVQYVKKEQEYRIHVGKMASGDDVRIISVQRKARNRAVLDQDVNWKVRNHSNGFIFVRGGVDPPPSVLHEASRALVASGLDFGAVDVIWNEKEQKAYVLEINTAPGLEGQTISDYADFFHQLGQVHQGSS